MEYIISPYRDYTTLQITLEVIATFFGIISVVFSKTEISWFILRVLYLHFYTSIYFLPGAYTVKL